MLRIFNSFVACLLSVLLVMQPFVANAGGVVVDSSVAANAAKMDVAPNGVPVVNIVKPTAAGVSHNKFTDFNVDSHGIIMNNSTVLGVSQLGGALVGNPNFTDRKTAKIILNEVTGNSRSALNGATEIFGDRAAYVLSNSNGITCNGCGFINTPRVTLTTGAPQMVGGDLRGFSVNGGDILFEGMDVNATNLDSFDIIARTAKITANIYAGGELNVVTGVGSVSASDRSVTPSTATGTAPTVAIDSSALGGMYAGKIALVSTESGVGVKTDGKLAASASDVILTADGRIEYKDVSAKNNIKITSKSSDIKHSGNSYSGGNTELSAGGAIEMQDGFTAAAKDIDFGAERDVFIDQAAMVLAGFEAIQNGSNVNFNNVGSGALRINAAGDVNNNGLLVASGELQAASSNLNNNGTLQSSGNATLTSGNVLNSGLIKTLGNMLIVADYIDNADTLSTDSFGNLTGGLVAGGSLVANSNNGIDNSNGAIAAGSVTLDTDTLTNSLGLIQSSGAADIKASGFDNTSGVVVAGGLLTLTTDTVTNTKGAIAADSLQLATSNLLLNTSGLIQTSGDMSITAAAVDNSNSYVTDINGSIIDGIIAGGNLVISASGINNNNGAIVAESLELTSSGDVDNTSGYISATGVLTPSTITASTINNTSGKILTASTLTLIADSVTNSSGLISSLKNLVINAATAVTNSGGVIYASEDLTASNVNNNNGGIQAGGDIAIDNNGGVFDNLGGQIYAVGSSSSISFGTLSNLLNLGGNIQAQGDIDAIIAADYTVNGDISSNGHIDITAWSLINNAKIQAADYIAFVLTSGGFTNSSGAEVISNTSVAVTATGNIDNSGKVSAPTISLTSTGGNLSNNSGAEITSSGTLTANIAGDINNSGRISSVGSVAITASNVSNSGMIATGNNLTMTITNAISNLSGAVIFALNNMGLYSNTLSNTEADIYADGGNITIAKDATLAKSASVTNTSGHIEARTGDIGIYTDSLVNQRTEYMIMYKEPDGMNLAAGYTDAKWLWVNQPYNDGEPWAERPNGFGRPGNMYWITILRAYGQNGPLSSIRSGNNLTINTNSLLNYGSEISAGYDLEINAPLANIINMSHKVFDWAVFASFSGKVGNDHWVVSYAPPKGYETYFSDENMQHFIAPDRVTLWFETTPLQDHITRATISAGNNLIGNVASLKNEYITEGGAMPIIVKKDGTTTTSSASININQLSINNGGSTIAAVDNGDLSYSSSPVLDASRFAVIPTGTNGLFAVNLNPASNYLIETNIAFVNLHNFMGSDYFLSRIGYNLSNGTKLLGDAFYTTRIVSDAIFERTGLRYLSSAIGTDFAQMQALMDNAVTEMAALNLQVGVELTAAQIAGLGSDIIWLVEDTINGHKVLKPVVYLSQATLASLDGHGAKIYAGNNVTIGASDKIVNGGQIFAGNNLSLIAQNDITNTGKLKAGRDISLTSIGGNINNIATVLRAGNGTTFATAALTAQGEIEAGRNATINAAQNINNVGSKISTGSDLTLTAGGNINITTDVLHNHTEVHAKKYEKTDDTVQNVRSEITSGGDLSITSGNNTILQAAKIKADGDVNLTAGNTLAFLTATDSEFHHEKKKKSSLVWQSSSDKGSYDETVLHTEITQGGELNIQAARIEAEIKKSGSVEKSIEVLSKEPGLEYLSVLKNNPNVNWTAINEAHQHWNYKQQGLTGAGAAIIAIALAVVTAGAGAALAGAALSTTLTGASAMMANAAFTSIVTQASISMVNNGGNLGATLKDLGSSEAVRNLAFAVVSAGAASYASGATSSMGSSISSTTGVSAEMGNTIANVGVRSTVDAAAHSAIYGDNFGDGLVDRLKSGAVYAVVDIGQEKIGESYHFGEINKATQFALHGGLGCAAGAAVSGNCGAGAAGAVAGELSSELYQYGGGTDLKTGRNIAEISGGAAALVPGGDAKDVYAGAHLGESAAENNNQLIIAAVALGGLYVLGNGDIVKGTEKLGMLTNQGKQYIYRKMEDGVYAVYEMSPEAVTAFGKGLAIPADGLHYLGKAVSSGVDSITGQPNSLKIAGATVSGFLNSVGLNDNFLTGLGVLAGGLGTATAIENGLANSIPKDYSLKAGTTISSPDFYVNSAGDVVPSTGYRAIVGNTNVNEALNGTIYPRNPATYFTFNDITNMSPSQVSNYLQLHPDYTPSHIAKFDTLQLTNNVSVPNGLWNTNSVPEPITSTYPNWGTGGGTQAITTQPIKVDQVIELPTGGN